MQSNVQDHEIQCVAVPNKLVYKDFAIIHLTKTDSRGSLNGDIDVIVLIPSHLSSKK